MNICLDKYQLISFDIFDTLLFRTAAKPIDVYEKVWQKAKESDICSTDISCNEFIKLRVEIERRARNRIISREVTLKDI